MNLKTEVTILLLNKTKHTFLFNRLGHCLNLTVTEKQLQNNLFQQGY